LSTFLSESILLTLSLLAISLLLRPFFIYVSGPIYSGPITCKLALWSRQNSSKR